jgi:hypothetical protein
LFTTAPDLVHWLDNFRDPKVGGNPAVDRLQEQAVLSNGKKIDYALGLSVGSYRGLKTVSHGGGDAGYRSFVVWFPELRLGVAVAGNACNFDSGGTAYKVAAVFAGDKMGPEPAKPVRQQITMERVTLDRYTGLYRMGSGMMLEFETKDGNLQGAPLGQPKLLLKPLAPNRFYAEQLGTDAEIEFTPKAASGMFVSLKHGDNSIEGERMTTEPFNPAELPQYVGGYWSDELETLYTMILRDGKPIANHIRHGEITLKPLARDQFIGGEWFMQDVRFTRDASGHVNGVILGGGRVRGVRFVKRP